MLSGIANGERKRSPRADARELRNCPLIAAVVQMSTGRRAHDKPAGERRGEGEPELDRDPLLRPVRDLVSLRDADVTGNVTVGDVAGDQVLKITVNFPQPALPAPARTLAPGASASFNSAEMNVPPAADELTITLDEPRV